ncbi:hypothetical protein ABIA31_006663 [Catenulispora sp. MAP5-51]
MAPRTTDLDFLNGRELAARGWTPAMIRDFLGSPDHFEYIPRFRNAAPMLQFALARVLAAERTAKWAARLELAAQRSAAARRAADRRREEMISLVADEMPIPDLGPDVLTDRAVRHGEPRDAIGAGKADHKTLNRWKVNYLQYDLIRFDEKIEGMFGQIGRAAAVKSLRRRALQKIGAAYPDLLWECQRQLRFSERRQ